jgi:N-acetylglutamate synthase-like GNAT family acetyltransferase
MQRSTVGSLLRSTQAYCSQLCEKETLDYGIAYYSPRYPRLPEANQFREVVIEDSRRTAEAFHQTQAWFTDRQLVCYRWAPAGGVATPELRGFLLERGFEIVTWTALSASRWVDFPPTPGIRVLPARAVRAAFRDTILHEDSSTPAEDRAVLADAQADRLDDPSFDMVVALDGNQPVGRCAMFQVGDIARVMDLTVLASAAGRGVETALLAHVLGLAKRLAMRNICAQVSSTDSLRLGWFAAAGFEPDGTIVEWERAGAGH